MLCSHMEKSCLVKKTEVGINIFLNSYFSLCLSVLITAVLISVNRGLHMVGSGFQRLYELDQLNVFTARSVTVVGNLHTTSSLYRLQLFGYFICAFLLPLSALVCFFLCAFLCLCFLLISCGVT